MAQKPAKVASAMPFFISMKVQFDIEMSESGKLSEILYGH
jgi:hypothetical protein